MAATEAYLVKCDIRALNHVFHKSIRQVIILNEQIVVMKARYERACGVDRKSMRYTLRLRLAAVEGTRDMYYEYARLKCREIEQLQDTLRALTAEEYDFVDEENNFRNEPSYQNLSEIAC